MNTYLITGGCGFIGSHIAEELAKKVNNKVIILDNLSSGYLKNIEHLEGKVEFVKADVRDFEDLLSITEGVDYIFHMASLISVFDSVKRPRESHDINLTGTLNILESAVKNKIKRIVIASSAAIYGNNPLLPKVETMLPEPESPYGLSKITKEYYGRIYSRLFGLKVICLRFFNVFGPRQDPSSPYSGVISKFVDAILANISPVIFGDGSQTRDFVFIKDVVKANILAMHCESLSGGEVFNIATGKSTDLLTLLEKINSILETSIEAVFKDSREGDIKHSLADINLAGKILGYKPSYKLENGLRELIRFYKK